MGPRDRKAAKIEKTAFEYENRQFVTLYQLIATKQMTKAKIMKKLKMDSETYDSLVKEYLRLYNGITG